MITTITSATIVVIGLTLVVGLIFLIGSLLIDFITWKWSHTKDLIQYFKDYREPENKKFFMFYARMTFLLWVIMIIASYI